MNNPIRILAVDDHALLRKGIAAILATQPDMIWWPKPPMDGSLSNCFVPTSPTLP
jgi:hypothetical protein